MAPLRSWLTALVSGGRSIEFVFEVTARCSPAAAFARIADLTTHPAWASRLHRQELRRVVAVDPDGPVGVGARYRSEATTYETTMPAELVVTRYERDRAFAYSATQSEGPPLVQGRWEHVFEVAPAGPGVTRIRRTLKVQKRDNHGRGIFRGSLARYDSVIRPNNLATLQNLVALLES
jgi:polyketide cyclase/dehydrase/lipid transport protein